jgi:hypothetical protein
MMATQRETVRLLCKSILNRLENQKAIQFAPRLRQIVQDEMFALVGPYILTDQDIRERAFARIGAKAEALSESSATETDQYRAAKAVIREQVGDDELNGFYFQKPVKTLALSIVEYLMRSSHIDDVYESDDELEKRIVETVRHFDVTALH